LGSGRDRPSPKSQAERTIAALAKLPQDISAEEQWSALEILHEVLEILHEEPWSALLSRRALERNP
jgi:hypothetical protein